MPKEIEFDDSEQSQFNAAIATLMRIHEIKKWLAIATNKEDLYFYYKHIKMLYKELAPMFRSKKEGEEKKSEREMQKEIWDDAKDLNFNTTNKEKMTEILSSLEEWELSLRQIEQDKGMNLPKKPDARWSLSRR